MRACSVSGIAGVANFAHRLIEHPRARRGRQPVECPLSRWVRLPDGRRRQRDGNGESATRGTVSRSADVPGTTAARFRINNLWGTHLRYDAWAVESGADITDSRGRTYDPLPEARKAIRPGLRNYDIKAHYRENPLVGMSCAVFEIPRSPRVIITGGSEICAWSDDDFPDDVHYSFTIIRTTLAVGG